MALIKKIKYEGVDGIRFGKYNIADNSTVVMYRIGDTIIDTGPPNQKRDVIKYLSEINIKKVLLTHHHEDHSGNAADISNYFDIPVHIHEKGLDPVKNGFPLRLYQKIFWGRPRKKQILPLPSQIDTGNGLTLEVIHTPGHSPDHVCFFEAEQKWLITGDLFLAVKPKLFRADEDLSKEIESLKKILTYDFETVFCAHKGVVEDGHTALRKKLDYFEELVETVKGMQKTGQSVKEIAHRLFGKRDTVGMISFKHICYENLVTQCLRV